MYEWDKYNGFLDLPHQYFSVVIWMPGPFPDSDVAPSIPILFVLPEIEFLHVGHRLEDETLKKDNESMQEGGQMLNSL